MTTELPIEQLTRVHAVNLAISYYQHLAKAPLFLPNRDDVDMAVEVKPELPDLLAAAEQIEAYITDGLLPLTEADRT